MNDETNPIGYGHFPIAPEYLTALLNVSSINGISPEACLKNSGLTPQVFFNNTKRVGNISLRIITANLLMRMPLEELVCQFLSQLGVFNHGALSIAIQSSANLKEALSAASLFADTRTAGKVLGFRENATHYWLELIEFADTIEADLEVDKFIVMSTLMVIARGLALLIKEEPPKGELIFGFPVERPEIFKTQMRIYKIAFNGNINALKFNKDTRFSPGISDRAVYRDAIRECESQRKAVSGRDEIEIRVRLELSRMPSQDLNIENISAVLCMCPRSMQRRLTLAGTSFRELKAAELYRRATYFLEHTGMTIENIARELGYVHPSNFIKSFKAQTKMSPIQYREFFASH